MVRTRSRRCPGRTDVEQACEQTKEFSAFSHQCACYVLGFHVDAHCHDVQRSYHPELCFWFSTGSIFVWSYDDHQERTCTKLLWWGLKSLFAFLKTRWASKVFAPHWMSCLTSPASIRIIRSVNYKDAEARARQSKKTLVLSLAPKNSPIYLARSSYQAQECRSETNRLCFFENVLIKHWILPKHQGIWTSICRRGYQGKCFVKLYHM